MSEPTIHFMAPGVTLWHGDCIETMRLLPDASVDSVVTDPPYGLEFMGKEWDSFGRDTGNGYREKPRLTDRADATTAFAGHRGQGVNSYQAGRPFQAWCTEWATEALRVLKPGGHLLAFGGSRTWHRLAAGIEDAGFEIRDSIAWLYGSGFPKSMDVPKAIDRFAGDDASVDGDQWQGWGTALKPAFEPIVVGRKPLAGTVAANVLAHGTGALNIDASRIETDDDRRRNSRGGDNGLTGEGTFRIRERRAEEQGETAGRWPTNVLLDPSQAAALDAQSGTLTSGKLEAHHARAAKESGILGAYGSAEGARGYGDSGGASRFFPTFRYEAKAATTERPSVGGVQHPTVKPLALMEWLIRLVTPPGGTVLEPFAGSGTTLEAAVREGFSVIGIEREADYLPLIVHRLTERDHQQSLFGDWEGGAA